MEPWPARGAPTEETCSIGRRGRAAVGPPSLGGRDREAECAGATGSEATGGARSTWSARIGVRRRWASVRRSSRGTTVLPEDAILLPERVEEIFLVAIHPPSQGQHEEAQRVGHGLRLRGPDTAVTHIVSGIHSPRPFSRTIRGQRLPVAHRQPQPAFGDTRKLVLHRKRSIEGG